MLPICTPPFFHRYFVRRIAALLGTAVLAMLLPLFGTHFFETASLSRYLAFPPVPQSVTYPALSYPHLVGLIILIAAPFGWFSKWYLRTPKLAPRSPFLRGKFTMWGKLGATGVLTFWIIAWTRYDVLAPLQLHTFFPLWISYILLINALYVERGGLSVIKQFGWRYIFLFLLSAGFWWTFEFLNRFAENWHYENVHTFSGTQYFWLATLSFSTVLPAVHGTARFLRTFSELSRFRNLPRATISQRCAILGFFVGGVLPLFLLPVFPSYLFPFLWLSPLILFASLVSFLSIPTFLRRLRWGDWTRPISYAFAALLCGVLWELWNYYSYARWVYAIPYVDAWRVFEMPLLGYVGYLPFGLLCGLVTEVLLQIISPQLIPAAESSLNQFRVSNASIPVPLNDRFTSHGPSHVAIIMDGNGRWATERGKERCNGHHAGIDAVRRVVRAAVSNGVRHLTLFAFSTENWNRPTEEIDTIFQLLESYLEKEVGTLREQGVRILMRGERHKLPMSIQHALRFAEYRTRHGKKLNLILAISHGGRAEIISACRQIAHEIEGGLYGPEAIDETLFRKHLQLVSIPDPDLIIRTSNEFRISNFLLWQLAYSEIVIQPVRWPDYNESHLRAALLEYARRERRFGSVSKAREPLTQLEFAI